MYMKNTQTYGIRLYKHWKLVILYITIKGIEVQKISPSLDVVGKKRLKNTISSMKVHKSKNLVHKLELVKRFSPYTFKYVTIWSLILISNNKLVSSMKNLIQVKCQFLLNNLKKIKINK